MSDEFDETQYDIWLNQLTVEEFQELTDRPTPKRFYELLDKVVAGGVYKLPVTEIPRVMASITRAISEFGDYTQLAINSMLHHLEDEDDD